MDTKPYALLLKLVGETSQDLFSQVELKGFLENKSVDVDCVYCEELDRAHPRVIRDLMINCQNSSQYVLTHARLLNEEVSCCSQIAGQIVKEVECDSSSIEMESGDKYNLYMLAQKE